MYFKVITYDEDLGTVANDVKTLCRGRLTSFLPPSRRYAETRCSLRPSLNHSTFELSSFCLTTDGHRQRCEAISGERRLLGRLFILLVDRWWGRPFHGPLAGVDEIERMAEQGKRRVNAFHLREKSIVDLCMP